MITKLRKAGISVKYDDRDTHKPGWKFAEYELKGVPVRIAIGPKDLENGTVEVARRDTLEKSIIPLNEEFTVTISQLLEDMQANIYKKAHDFRAGMITKVESYEEFKSVLDEKGGFVLAHWDGTSETEEKVKDETKATIRCIPLDGQEEAGKCMVTGKPSKQRVIFARAY
jgi:prolyl-tRNA synthetase